MQYGMASVYKVSHLSEDDFRRQGPQARHKHQNLRVLLSVLKQCSRTRDLLRGKKVHADAIRYGHDCNIYVGNTLIDMYAKCGSMVDARNVFDKINFLTVVSWNSLILGYAVNGQGCTALEIFSTMRIEGQAPDSVTLVAALKACNSLAVEGAAECWSRIKRIHNFAMQDGCSSDVYVQSTLVNMYAKCGSMADAQLEFDSMRNPNVVSWTALILGYANNSQGDISIDIFTRMIAEGFVPDFVTLVAVLKACTSLAVKGGDKQWVECRNRGKKIHSIAVQNGCDMDGYLQNTLVDMFAKCGSMVDACDVFNGMKHLTTVSWAVLILGYLDNGQGQTALDMFTRMRIQGPAPNSVAFGAALKACALVGAVELGRAIHSEIDVGNGINIIVVNCLVDFYAKCGSLAEAKSVFDLHAETRNVVTWTALMAGFGSWGDNETVFRLFKDMQDEGIKPDGVTFSCILTCCSHANLVLKGKECFDTMFTMHGVIPTVEHYNCMIDLLGRANRIDDAVALLEQMSCGPNDVTWITILSACRKWKNVEIGRLAYQHINGCFVGEKDC